MREYLPSIPIFHPQDGLIYASLDKGKKKRPDFSGLFGQYRMILDFHLVAMQGLEPRTPRI